MQIFSLLGPTNRRFRKCRQVHVWRKSPAVPEVPERRPANEEIPSSSQPPAAAQSAEVVSEARRARERAICDRIDAGDDDAAIARTVGVSLAKVAEVRERYEATLDVTESRAAVAPARDYGVRRA